MSELERLLVLALVESPLVPDELAHPGNSEQSNVAVHLNRLGCCGESEPWKDCGLISSLSFFAIELALSQQVRTLGCSRFW